MSDIRKRIEAGFYNWGGIAFDRAHIILPLGFLVILGFISQLVSPKIEISSTGFSSADNSQVILYGDFNYPFNSQKQEEKIISLSLWRDIRIDTSTEGFLHSNDPKIEAYDRFKDIFGRDDMLIVAIESKNIFDIKFLKNLAILFNRFEMEVPYVKEVQSLMNARYVYGIEDELFVEDLMEIFPQTERELAELEQKARSGNLYLNVLFSEDASLANLIIRFDGFYRNEVTGEYEEITDDQIIESLLKVNKILDQECFRFVNCYVAGVPAVSYTLQKAMAHDMGVFSASLLILIVVLLFLIFRRFSGVLMPAFIVVVSLLSTMSLLAIFNQPVQLPTTIIPSFILSVAVGDSVHLLTHFYRFYDEHGDKRLSLEQAMGHTGVPMFLTSLTTAAGLSSFASAEILPVANLGIFSAAGVILAFVFTIVFIPAFIRIFPIKHHRELSQEQAVHHAWFIKFTDLCADTAIVHAKKVVVVSAVIFCAMLYQASQLTFTHNPLGWFDENEEIRIATNIIDSRLGGTVPLELMIQASEPDGIKNSELMKSMERLESFLKSYDKTIKINRVISPTDIVKETNRALHGNDPAKYSIPEASDLIAQELFLFELSDADQLRLMVDSNYEFARTTAVTPWVNSNLYADVLDDITEHAEQTLKGTGASFIATGIVPLLSGTLNSVMHSTVSSYLIAFCVITMMMILLLGKVNYGLVSMFPNLMPIVIVLGTMRIMDIGLDMFTMLIGSIAIGLAVDDTVHFMHNFMRLNNQDGDTEKAIRETLHTTGKAMLVTSVVLTLGFFVYVLSDLQNLFNFGLLTGCCIVLALIADFLLAPALMMLMHPGPSES